MHTWCVSAPMSGAGSIFILQHICCMHLIKENVSDFYAMLTGKLLAYNCSPSFNWKRHLDDATIATFQQEIGKMGYKFQFVTLAGFHSLNHAMFELSTGYAKRGMAAYSELQQLEFASEAKGYTCSKHQREVSSVSLFSSLCSSLQWVSAWKAVMVHHMVAPGTWRSLWSSAFAKLCNTLL